MQKPSAPADKLIVRGVASWPGEDVPVFDERTFDETYFSTGSNYAGRYDWYNPAHKIAGYLAEIRRVRSEGSLLDVGCASGKFLEMAQGHFRCEGVDISSYALGLAKERLPWVPLHHSSIQTFQPAQTYDVITCFDMLEHIPDLAVAFSRIRALLAPEGILTIAVPVYDTPPGRVFRLIDRDPTHVHRYGRHTWLERLAQAGFEPIVRRGILRAPLPGYFVHLISPLFWRFSSAIFVICKQRRIPSSRT